MKVILLKTIKNLGKENQVVNVKDGYAQNFLFPKKLATPANDKKINIIQHRKEKEEKLHQKEEKEINKLINKLQNKKITISKDASEKGKLFASVSAEEILSEIKKNFGVSLKKEDIKLKDHIKEVGESELGLKISGKNVKIKVIVKSK